nr:hypothetical protein [Tanacetum cinerariifolium]
MTHIEASPPLSPAYIVDTNPKEDPEEDPVDYPADGGDDDDESSEDDADDEDEDEASEEEDNDKEDEDHLASSDSSVVPIVDPVLSAEDTEAFETNESAPTPPSPRPRRARISVRLEPHMAASTEARIIEYVVAHTSPSPPPSPLTPLSSPLPYIPSPSLPLPSPSTHTSPTYAEAPLGYKAVGIRLRAESPLPLPTSSSPLLLSATGRREDFLEADVPPQKRCSQERESEEFYTRHQDAHDNRAAVRAEIEVLRRERLVYEREREREISETRQALAKSEAHNRALEAWIATIKTQLYRLVWQRQDADDHANRAMIRVHVLEDRAHIDTLEDTGSCRDFVLFVAIMYGMLSIMGYSQKIPPKRTAATTTPMTDSQIRALISQRVTDALAEHEANRSRNGDDNHDSGTGVRRQNTRFKQEVPIAIYKLDYINLYGFFLNKTMDMTIDQQVAMDEALIPHARRLRIGRSNFRLLSDITSKESTLQLVYDVLRLTPFFKAFLIIADVSKIYMQEFWATTTVHHHSIRFKIDNKKHIVKLESFREMLHICPGLPHQPFVKPPFEEEILAFLRFLRHSGEIRRLTDVNINKLHQPWRSYAAIINKCLTKKRSGYDSLRLSQAQILWGLYHKRNVDFAYLMWEDFVYQSSSQFVTSMLNPTPDAGIESIFEPTSQMDVQTPTSVAPLPVSAPTLTPSTIATITTTLQAPTPPTTAPSTLLQDLPNFGSLFGFDHRLKILEANFYEFTQTNQFARAVSFIPEIRNLYKALVEAYESDKIILDTYGDTVTLKRHHDDDEDKDEEPFVGSDRGSKRQFEIGADDQPIVEPSQLPEWFSQQKKPPTPNRDWNKTLPATHESIQPWISELEKLSDSRSSFNELMDTLVNFSAFLMNRLKGDTLTPELLAGPTYKLMKGSCKSLVELELFLEEVYKATTDKGRKRQQFYGFAVNQKSARDVYSKRRIVAVIELKIIEWHNYKHLDWITVHRDDDKFYKFKKCDFKRLCIQDIEDMLLLLVQGKLTNLTVEERFAFNVSLQMFTRSIVIQRHVEDLQLGVERYQKKLNLTKPDTYRSDLKCKEAYIADGTLTDVRTALDDRLKGIQMNYLTQTIWRKSDKDRATAMI